MIQGFRYDPSQAPDRERWLALDEQTRIELVLSYLQRQEKVAVLRIRAASWAVVENQLAMDLAAVVDAMTRLTNEGLARAKVIALIARELIAHMQDVSNGAYQADYDARLARLEAIDALT